VDGFESLKITCDKFVTTVSQRYRVFIV